MRLLRSTLPGIAVALFAVLLACGPRPALGQTLLRWKLAPRQQLELNFEQATETFTELNGVRVAMNIEMRMQLGWTVVSVDEQGAARVTQTIDRLQLKMQPAKGEAVEYDSQQPAQTSSAAREIAGELGPILQSTVSLMISDRGQILDVEVSQEAAEALEKLPASSAFKSQL